MFPFLLPLLAVGLCVMAARHHRREGAPMAAIVSGDVPSPLGVFCAHLRAGRQPPPPVILCAIAEAESTGQYGLADQIVRTFIAPVVMGAVAAAKDANAAPAKKDPYGGRHHVPLYSKEQQQKQEAAKAEAAENAAAQKPNADGSIPVKSDDDISRAMAAMAAQHAGISEMRSARVAHPTSQTRIKGSPIAGIGADAWGAFVGRVAREAPSFAGPRHVGQFRQRRDRLVELDIDPESIINDPNAQLDALDADMSDAYEHARAGGLADHVGRDIEINGEPHEVTLSGVMGVVQAAGLEGAVEWLEQPRDRQRFPHTTAAFVRCNGAF